jgi:hypothetical protein
MKWLFNFSILAFLWSIYYLAKRITGNALTTTDILVCGSVIAFCTGMIAYYLIKKYKQKKDVK